MPRAAGDLVANKYRIERLLGQGGFGTVYAATHVALHSQVALKFLAQAADPATRKRFLREARACVKLQSEHVARVLDVVDEDQPYIVMEFLEGTDLRERLETHGPLSIADACELVIHACHGLTEAHSRGIVHRDVKPANLVLTKDRHGLPVLKVLDFGISKVGHDAREGSMTNVEMLGTPRYMSPEQIASTKNVDHRTDIWSLGVTLFELLTQSPPFQAPTLMNLITMVTFSDAPRVEKIRADVPSELGDVIDRCLKKTVEERVATCADLARALQPFGPARAIAVIERVMLLPPPANAPRSGSLAPAAPEAAPETLDAPSESESEKGTLVLPHASVEIDVAYQPAETGTLVISAPVPRAAASAPAPAPAPARARPQVSTTPVARGIVAGVLVFAVASVALVAVLHRRSTPRGTTAADPESAAVATRTAPPALVIPSDTVTGTPAAAADTETPPATSATAAARMSNRPPGRGVRPTGSTPRHAASARTSSSNHALDPYPPTRD